MGILSTLRMQRLSNLNICNLWTGLDQKQMHLQNSKNYQTTLDSLRVCEWNACDFAEAIAQGCCRARDRGLDSVQLRTQQALLAMRARRGSSTRDSGTPQHGIRTIMCCIAKETASITRRAERISINRKAECELCRTVRIVPIRQRTRSVC